MGETNNTKTYINIAGFVIMLIGVALAAGKILGDIEHINDNGCSKCQQVMIDVATLQNEDKSLKDQLGRIEKKVDSIDDFLRSQ